MAITPPPIPTQFQSTLPARGATPRPIASDGEAWTFQSTLPARGATVQQREPDHYRKHFNPRSPRGERLGAVGAVGRRNYFNPRSPRGERLDGRGGQCCGAAISIHAPREGSDGDVDDRPFLDSISIHAPREGSDRLLHNLLHAPLYFNPRSPRGERHQRWR